MKKTIQSLFSFAGIVTLSALMTMTAFAVDSTSPGNVKNLKATAYDGSVRLTWDAATDDVGVTGYEIHYGETSVTEQGQKYDDSVDVGNVLEYVVTGLENDKTYYFSAFAYDEAENESQDWALEVSIAPDKDAGVYVDEVAPKVSMAEALNTEEVKVVFSEKVVLPAEDPQDAFLLEDDDNLVELPVLNAVSDTQDSSGRTVILTTAKQTEGITYKLTVTIDIEDVAGNPIISGTSDTAIFVGSGDEKEPADAEGPELKTVTVTDSTHITVNFNEKVVLAIDRSENFNIASEDDPNDILEVLDVKLVPNSEGVIDAAATLTTEPQEAAKSYVVTALDVEDEAGNELLAAKSSLLFDGFSEDDTPDTEIKVTDVAALIADVKEEAEKYLVTLSWEIPSENEGNLLKQIMYFSTNNKDYSKDADLDADALKYEVTDLEAGEYWFKLTQQDMDGNETKGVIKKVVLSETGPGVAGLILISLGLGRYFGKRKNQ